jgi:hypothetical protein
MPQSFSSRKFLLFLIAILTVTAGWVYSLIYKPEQITTISALLVTLLGSYSATNLVDTNLANKLTIATAPPATPAASPQPCQPNITTGAQS